MEDLSSLYGDMEGDFVNLVRQGYSQALFVRNAEIMAGQDWKESGREIIAEFAPELLKKFDEYVSGADQKST